MENNKKKVLIVGSSIASMALAKKLHAYDNVEEIFAIGIQAGMPEYVKQIDIREDKVAEILNFVFEYSVDFTICFSKEAIKADIAHIFNANGQMIFAPDAESAKQIIDEALTKKFLYKLRIPTSKFGVFEKQQYAYDYLKTAKFPLVIKTSEPLDERDLFACPTVSVANIALNDLFFRSADKVVIEEFQNGHNFTYYVISDGYKALPLGILTSYRFSDEVNGGYLTKGSAALMPDFKVTKDLEHKLMRDVVMRVTEALERARTPYLGILGFHCVLNEENILVQSISPFVEDVDAQILFNSIEDNLLTIFEACAMGVFADDYEHINTNDLASVSISLLSRTEGAEISGLENLDFSENLILSTKKKNDGFVTQKGCIGTLCASASTLKRAKDILTSEIECIRYDGMKWRKDVLL